jgi:hypothetical protein
MNPPSEDHLALLRLYLRYVEDPEGNEDQFHAWEWLMWLSRQHPKEAWIAYRWLASNASSTIALERIGCGPLLDFLWQHPQYAEKLLEAAHADERFYLAARWCELDPDSPESEAMEFSSRLGASPFAPKHEA